MVEGAAPMDFQEQFAGSKRRVEEAGNARVAKAKPAGPPAKKPGQSDAEAAADAAESSGHADGSKGRGKGGKGAGKNRGNYAQTGEGGPFPDGGNNRPVPNAILNVLLTDHLALRNEARLHFNSNSIAFILDLPEAIDSIQKLSVGWEAQKPLITPEMHASKTFPAHPSGYFKRAFVFMCILELIKNDEPCDEVTKAISFLQKANPAVHAESITACAPKYPRPMPGRIWLFSLILSMVASEEYRAAVIMLDCHKSKKKLLRIEPRREAQSMKEKVMWEHVKSHPLPARKTDE
jgi:hypothetical protein